MRMHRIEVDDEVFAHLKSEAEPLVDTANSVLRRKLLGGRPGRSSAAIRGNNGWDGSLPPMPLGTPRALQEILEVVHRVRNSGSTRTDATQHVAHRRRVTPQTVIDKYTRQLNLTASRFDDLLGQGDLGALRALLKQKFPDHNRFVIKLRLGQEVRL